MKPVPDVLDLATFGQRLRHHRLARGLTLTALGERVGIRIEAEHLVAFAAA